MLLPTFTVPMFFVLPPTARVLPLASPPQGTTVNESLFAGATDVTSDSLLSLQDTMTKGKQPTINTAKSE
jgi:hypothetical protein